MARHGFWWDIIVAIWPVQERFTSLWKILEYKTAWGAAPFQGPATTCGPIFNIETESREDENEVLGLKSEHLKYQHIQVDYMTKSNQIFLHEENINIW